MAIAEVSNDAATPAVHAANTAGGDAVFGHASQSGRGVVGVSDAHTAVEGNTATGVAVWGSASAGGRGVVGISDQGTAVEGNTRSGTGLWGSASAGGRGVVGISDQGTAVEGNSADGTGVWAQSESNEGVHAVTRSPVTAAVAAYNLNPAGTGAAIFGQKDGAVGHAGYFSGNVWIDGLLVVTRDIVLENADCAEDFDIAPGCPIEPGSVVVLGDDAVVSVSSTAYDRRVAGVVSGAGSLRPGLILDRRRTTNRRQPVALLGKVYCKADAGPGPIEVGDMLTTSTTPGHAMKAADPSMAFGATLGKALQPLKSGVSLICVLVALR